MSTARQTLSSAFNTSEYQTISDAVKRSTGRKPGGAQRNAYGREAKKMVAEGKLSCINRGGINLYRKRK